MKQFLVSLIGVMLLGSLVSAAGLIDIAYSPYTISNAESYIVVSNLTTLTNQIAILILYSNVTLDLNGHTLYGAGTAGTTGNGFMHSVPAITSS